MRKAEKCSELFAGEYPKDYIEWFRSEHEYAIRDKKFFDKGMVIGEAGESCAFYIADRLGMPESMLRVATEAAYGKSIANDYVFRHNETIKKKSSKKLEKKKKVNSDAKLSTKFQIGDSVKVLPDNKIGIVCEPINEKGV